MKIGHILDAIEISSFVPSEYPSVLQLGYEIARFGRPMTGLSTNPLALGRELKRQRDFFHCRSGLLDSHRVMFDLDDILAGANGRSVALASHLKWMIDCRRNPGTISVILDQFKKQKDKRQHDDLATLSPEILATALLAHLDTPAEKNIAVALIEGDFSKIPDQLSASAPPSKKLQRTIRRMYVYWCLFDLQIMSSRLFHAEWNALEAGAMEDPSLVTMNTVTGLMERLREAAIEFETAFKNGLDGDDLSERWHHFIKEHGLEGHARRNAALMKIDAAGRMPPSQRRKLIRFLNDVRLRAEHVHGEFVATRTDKTELKTIVHRARMPNEKRVAKQSPKDEIAAILEANACASSMRFSMPVLTALSYSVLRVVAAIRAIPADENISSYRGEQDEEFELLSPGSASALRSRLLMIYRGLFSRDSYLQRGEDNSVTTRVVLPPSEARGLDRKIALKLGAGIESKDVLLDREVRRNSPADARKIEGYRQTEDPAVETLNWIFESSLWGRLDGSIRQPHTHTLCA